MTLWRRMFTDEVMDYFFYYLYLPVILNSEYRECEQRTYIVKEHYEFSQRARAENKKNSSDTSDWPLYS